MKQNSPTGAREKWSDLRDNREVVSVPAVVEPVRVPVPPATVAVQAQHVAVATRGLNLYVIPSVPPPLVPLKFGVLRFLVCPTLPLRLKP